jgi:hypothetical protein
MYDGFRLPSSRTNRQLPMIKRHLRGIIFGLVAAGHPTWPRQITDKGHRRIGSDWVTASIPARICGGRWFFPREHSHPARSALWVRSTETVQDCDMPHVWRTQ